MEPEFQRAIVIVLIAGTFIAAVGTGVLLLVFRKFDTNEAGRSSHVGLMAGLIAFIFACCLLLFALSYAGD